MELSNIERILETLVYIVRDGDRELEVLLMLRREKPNLGKWVPLGGQVRFNESPLECSLREIRKVGIEATQANFRGLITEISPFENKQWLLFIYIINKFSGEIEMDLPQGESKWWPLSQIHNLPKPKSDTIFSQEVLEKNTPFYEATMQFDESIKIVETRLAKH